MKSTLLNNFSNSLIGRLFVITLIIAASCVKIYLGILLVLLVTVNPIEGFTNDTLTEVDKFRMSNCRENKLYKNDENVTIDQIKQLFPSVKFNNDKCNPCDTSCEFNISKSKEQLSTEEFLNRGAGQSSKQFRTGKSTSSNEPSPIPSLNKSSKKSIHARTNIE
jgi:hypothetical protein|tara:strand:- start:5820 stop:6311 length:492 start_codon:yes stop_codon:yes gene_type:complete